MRANKGWIWALALGLVIATTIVIAVVAHAIVPQMGWGAAFVLGAVVAATDEIAVAPIAALLGVPGDVQAIVEGESLANDAFSLVMYSAGVAAVVTGTFAWVTTFSRLCNGRRRCGSDRHRRRRPRHRGVACFQRYASANRRVGGIAVRCLRSGALGRRRYGVTLPDVIVLNTQVSPFGGQRFESFIVGELATNVTHELAGDVVGSGVPALPII
jgi:hypothetical protein